MKKIKDFHFVLNSRFKKLIVQMAKSRSMTFSQFVVFMIERGLPYIIRVYNIVYQGNLQSRKPVVDADADSHVYMKIKLYERLKGLHGGKNTFSVAMIVRDAIELFLWGVGIYGWDGFLKWLDKEIKKMYRKKRRARWGNIKIRDILPFFIIKSRKWSQFLIRKRE